MSMNDSNSLSLFLSHWIFSDFFCFQIELITFLWGQGGASDQNIYHIRGNYPCMNIDNVPFKWNTYSV